MNNDKEQVKRFDSYTMDEREDGDFVKSEDYDGLAKHIAELEAHSVSVSDQITEIARLLENTADLMRFSDTGNSFIAEDLSELAIKCRNIQAMKEK